MKIVLLVTYILAIGFPLVFLQACPTKDLSQTSKSNNSNATKIVTKEMARKIAQEFISKEYDVSNYDLTVHDREGYWGFEFAKPVDDRHSEGRGAIVEVNKKDGSIRRYYIGK